jgi:histidinol-phosphate aminotransferase
MQTLSKAWGLAGLRLGLAFASLDIIDLFNKVKPPYNINASSQHLTLEALKNTAHVNEWIKEIVDQRNSIKQELSLFPFVKKIYESDANFLLVKVEDADSLYQYLRNKKIVVRNRSKEVLCENCIRITIGTLEENKTLLEALKNYNS